MYVARVLQRFSYTVRMRALTLDSQRKTADESDGGDGEANVEKTSTKTAATGKRRHCSDVDVGSPM